MPASPHVVALSPSTAYTSKDNIVLPTAAGAAATVATVSDARQEDVFPTGQTVAGVPSPPTGGG